MKKLLHLVAVPLLAVGITGGLASAATSTSIDTTGPESEAIVDVTNNNEAELQNNNNTTAAIGNSQNAVSGSAEVKKNTTGEDATTGDAETEFAVDAVVEHTNASSNEFALGGDNSCSCGDEVSIENTGPKSDVEVTIDNNNQVKVTNNNNLTLSVQNTQNSVSGDAKVYGNTTGGGAHTGNASAKASVSISDFTSN